MSKLDTILAGLQKAGQIITIGAPLAGGAINLGTGALISFRKLRENAAGATEYQLVISLGKAELAEANASADKTLSTINAELARMGKPTIPTT